jgi:hydrogenase expression/formation protein HypE
LGFPATFPLGKLPPEWLARLIVPPPGMPLSPRVIVCPGVGLDCAVLDFGDRYLVAKSDPITFATDEIGWYAVQVNANDIACSGAQPQFFLATLLLPHSEGNAALADHILAQITSACQELGAALVGGHTEITYGLDRPIVVGTMLGEVDKDKLITAAGAQVGDAVLLTKGYPIEAVSIIAREVDAARGQFSSDFLDHCRNFLRAPGISVVKDARVALGAGTITAMHDPTEGGVATGLWELADASGHGIAVNLPSLPLLPEGDRLCRALNLDPLGCIASGALLLTTPEPEKIRAALEAEGIPAYVIGQMIEGQAVNLPRPARDEIAKLFSTDGTD